MVKMPAVLARAPLVTPPVEVGPGVLVVTVKLEIRELAELRTELREEREEESPELVDDDDEEVRDDPEDNDVGRVMPLKVEVGGLVEMRGGREGMDVELPTQTSLPPTVITGVALPMPSESESTITTPVPEVIVTWSQVKKVPLTPEKAARTLPPAPPSWKERLNGPTPVVVSYSTVRD